MTRRIYHVPHGTPYHQENSLRGIRKAAAEGYTSIDLDMQMTKDGVIVGTHWGQPMLRDGFRDPLLPLARKARVADMKWRRVRRLRTKDGGYRIQRLETLLAECARLDIEAVLEPKSDPRFRTVATWQRIRVMQRVAKARIAAYALPELGGAESMKAAKEAGVKDAWVIRHG
ncbi:MAG: hypothetical protein J7518_20415 [Nocardioidaceae bacterium]|nr:hypothetical protein [Nocardioidaceae bacterium]